VTGTRWKAASSIRSLWRTPRTLRSTYPYILIRVGTGESERPDEAELEIIEQYTDELDEKYGIDPLQSDFISFYYEPEQEY
jgi:hypothetical protein